MIKTENTQNFYYIKQLACLMAVAELKQVVEVDGVEVTKAKLAKDLLSEIQEVKLNFVTPTLTLKTDRSVVDLPQVYKYLILAQRRLLRYEPTLEAAVNDAPDLADLTQLCYHHFVDNGGEFTFVRQAIVNIIKLTDTLFETLELMLIEEETIFSLMTLLSYINLIAAIEFFFSLSEWGKSGFNDERKYPDPKDNPWTS